MNEIEKLLGDAIELVERWEGRWKTVLDAEDVYAAYDAESYSGPILGMSRELRRKAAALVEARVSPAVQETPPAEVCECGLEVGAFCVGHKEPRLIHSGTNIGRLVCDNGHPFIPARSESPEPPVSETAEGAFDRFSELHDKYVTFVNAVWADGLVPAGVLQPLTDYAKALRRDERELVKREEARPTASGSSETAEIVALRKARLVIASTLRLARRPDFADIGVDEEILAEALEDIEAILPPREPVSPPPVELSQGAGETEARTLRELAEEALRRPRVPFDAKAAAELIVNPPPELMDAAEYARFSEPVEAGVELPDGHQWRRRDDLGSEVVAVYTVGDPPATIAGFDEWAELPMSLERAIASQAAAEERSKWERRVDQAVVAAANADRERNEDREEIARLRVVLDNVRAVAHGTRHSSASRSILNEIARVYPSFDLPESRGASASTEAK